MPVGAAAILPTGPGSKSRTTENSKPAGANLGPGRPQASGQTNAPRANPARERLNAVAKDMSEGKISSREQRIDAEEPIIDPSEVSDSAAIAPTKEPPAPEPKAEKPAKPVKDEEAGKKAGRVAAAKRALALDGWTPEDIAELKEDKLLRMGEHRAKNQADVNREFAKLRNASTEKARNTDGTFAAPDAEPTAEGKQAEKPAKPAQVESLDPEVEAMIESEKEEIGPRATALMKSMALHFQRKIGRSGETGNAVTTELLTSMGAQIVEADYPDQLAENPQAFSEVVENFRSLVESNRYGPGQISKAWRDAAFMAFGQPKTVRKAQRAMLARQQAADDGYVDPGRGDTGATTEAPLSNKDALKLAGQMMAANPRANPERLREEIMGRVRGRR